MKGDYLKKFLKKGATYLKQNFIRKPYLQQKGKKHEKTFKPH